MLNQNCTHLRRITLHSEECILKPHLEDTTPIHQQPLLEMSNPQRNLRSVLICGMQPQTIPLFSQLRSQIHTIDDLITDYIHDLAGVT